MPSSVQLFISPNQTLGPEYQSKHCTPNPPFSSINSQTVKTEMASVLKIIKDFFHLGAYVSKTGLAENN